ncbi:MAG: hypothetical protein L0I29_15535 [Hyphomicrobiales bacterium]|nr:hypothetical protein [Hyphomicrobiales bacterium]
MPRQFYRLATNLFEAIVLGRLGQRLRVLGFFMKEIILRAPAWPKILG